MNQTKESACFKLTKNQVIALIVIYNILHIIACAIGSNSFVLSVLYVFLVVLASIYLVVLLNALEKKSNDLNRSLEENNIIKSLRNEYRTILQHKKRKQLFKQQCSIDTPLKDSSVPAQRIHLDYLKKIISDDNHG